MTPLYIVLTVVIALATCAQALFAWRLWELQKSMEEKRSQTFVAVALDIRHTHEDPPTRSILRLENGSSIGIVVSRIKLRATANGHAGPDVPMMLNFTVGPYQTKEIDISNFVKDETRKVDPQNPAWNGQPHSVGVRVIADYRAEGQTFESQPLQCRIDFQAAHFEKMEYI